MTPKRSRREKEKRIYKNEIRPFIVERANGQCEEEIDGVRCMAIGTDPHHIHSRRGKALIDPGNIILLCSPHHRAAEKNLKESRWRHDEIRARKH